MSADSVLNVQGGSMQGWVDVVWMQLYPGQTSAIDWCCIYYFVSALLEALWAQTQPYLHCKLRLGGSGFGLMSISAGRPLISTTRYALCVWLVNRVVCVTREYLASVTKESYDQFVLIKRPTDCFKDVIQIILSIPVRDYAQTVQPDSRVS